MSLEVASKKTVDLSRRISALEEAIRTSLEAVALRGVKPLWDSLSSLADGLSRRSVDEEGAAVSPLSSVLRFGGFGRTVRSFSGAEGPSFVFLRLSFFRFFRCGDQRIEKFLEQSAFLVHHVFRPQLERLIDSLGSCSPPNISEAVGLLAAQVECRFVRSTSSFSFLFLSVFCSVVCVVVAVQCCLTRTDLSVFEMSGVSQKNTILQ
jgi:hypothetical protein